MYRLPSPEHIPQILRAAARVDDALAAALQAVEHNGRCLRFVESVGLQREYLERFASVEFGSGTACTQAAVERRRVVIRDVLTDAAFQPHAAGAIAAGYRAVQSTPLFDGEFRVIGVLSTYFAAPHHPGPESIARLDLYGRVTALLLELDQLQQSIVEADRRLSIQARTLSTTAVEASTAARRMLTLLEYKHSDNDLASIARYLETMTKELRAALSQSRGLGIREPSL